MIIGPMQKPTIALSTLWLLFMASPLWLVLIIAVPANMGGGLHRFVMAPLVLLGITVAIQRLLRGYTNAWTLAALMAGTIAFAALSLSAWIAS